MRRKKYIESKKNNGSKKHGYLYYLFGIASLLVVIVGIFLSFSFINLDKYSFVTRDNDSGNTDIYIVDTKSSMVKRYSIAGSLLVNSSLNYGEYTLSNLWHLADKEKLGGELIAKTIVKNFGLPVYYYLDGSKTNMSLVYLLKSKIILADKKEVDREITSDQLTKSILVDFVDDKIQEIGAEVVILDATGGVNISEKVSEVINVLGSKVVDYQKTYDPSLYCLVEGSSSLSLTKTLGEVFKCQIVNKNKNDNRVVIKIGEKFLLDF